MTTMPLPKPRFRARVAAFLAVPLVCGPLAGCAPMPPQSAYTQPVPPADLAARFDADPAVWGAYAGLVGHRFNAEQPGTPGYEVSWSRPGQEIRETARQPGDGAVMFSRTIRPGARPGQLVSNLHGVEWLGTVQADGSVLFLHKDGIAPYRIRQSPNGAYVHEIVEASADGQVTNVLFSTPYPEEGGAERAIAQTGTPAPVAEPAATEQSVQAPTEPALAREPDARPSDRESDPAEPLSTGTSDSAAQDAQVAALLAQNQALAREMGIEAQVNAEAERILAQIEQQNAASQPTPPETAQQSEPAAAPANGSLTKTVRGVEYSVSPTLPAAIKGEYEYEDGGEPIVRILEGEMASAFQPHGDPEIPITAWLARNPDGSDLREEGGGGRYQLTLVIQYGKGGGGNYPEGSYDLLPVVVIPSPGRAVILGERIKNHL